jgi:hypothetical protein
MYNELSFQNKELAITGAALLAGVLGYTALGKMADHSRPLRPFSSFIGIVGGVVSFKAAGDFLDTVADRFQDRVTDDFGYPPHREMEM